MKTKDNDGCPVKTKGLHLKRYNNSSTQWIDQYGRVLELYINEKGEQDLKPVGVGIRK